MAEQIGGDRPGRDVRAGAPAYRMAKRIRVESAPNGAPVISIDGYALPWYTQGIVVPVPAIGQCPTVTVTFLAEHVEMVNRGPRPHPSADADPE